MRTSFNKRAEARQQRAMLHTA